MRQRRAEPLYAPLPWVMVRAPLLPVAAYPSEAEPAAGAVGWDALDPIVCAALAVGSPDLVTQLERSQATGARARASDRLLRYRIRMATRPTPYGLFAAVALAKLGPASDVCIAERLPRTRTRPDMAWLLAFVTALESRPEVRRKLGVRTNPAVFVLDGRAILSERAALDGGGEIAAIDIRATNVVRHALARARDGVGCERLAEALTAAPGATAEKVESLLSELCEQSILLTDLRPPLTHPSPAHYVSERLAGIDAAHAEKDLLDAVLAEMANLDRAPVDRRPAALRRLRARARRAVDDFDGDPVQVDAALEIEPEGHVHERVAIVAAEAVELLLRLAPNGRAHEPLTAYRDAFVDRYGAHREVPLLEMLDPQRGLGPHDERPSPPAMTSHAQTLRHQTLAELASDALRERRLVVELDEPTLDRLGADRVAAIDAPLSLDLSVFVLARSSAAIDADDFRLLIGPNLGAQQAGRNLGRFGDLLAPDGRSALAAIAEAEAARHPDDLFAEIVYLPRRGRSANVVVRPAVRSHEIVIGTTPGVAGPNVIPLADLVIGVRGDRFYVRWPAARGDVQVRAGHMLNVIQAPAPCRFLEEVARDGRLRLQPFDWGPVRSQPFLPRMQAGRIVLLPAQWSVSSGLRDTQLAAGDARRFPDALTRWRADWMVPRRVYLSTGDNRLLLDLETASHAELLRQELCRQPARSAPLRLQEPLPGPEHAWLPGPDGNRLAELVVSLVRSTPTPAVAGRGAARARPAPARAQRLRPPGSDWLYAKLYGPRTGEEQLLSGHVRHFCEFAVGSGSAQRWFFVRYADPEPHLRLRFGGDPQQLVGELLPALVTWMSELVADGCCSRVCVDTYDREIERYGGVRAIDLAEELFFADSRMVVDLLASGAHDDAALDRTTLAVVTIDALLSALGLDATQRTSWCHEAVAARHESGEDYRARRTTLRRLLDDPQALLVEPAGATVARALAARRSAIAPLAARLAELDRHKQLTAPLARLCRSHVHMHCNRLLHAGTVTEQRVLGLLLRARVSLERAPLPSGARRDTP